MYAGDIGSAMGSAAYHLVASAGTNTYEFTSTEHPSAVTVAAVFAPGAVDGGILDANSDGVADAWTVHHFAYDPFVDGLADNDPDGDTLSNYDEYIVGSDPTNALDGLEISVTLSNGAIVVSVPSRLATSEFYGSLSRRYGLESSTNLRSTNWIPVLGAEELPATGFDLSHTNDWGGLNVYYRAKVWLESD